MTESRHHFWHGAAGLLLIGMAWWVVCLPAASAGSEIGFHAGIVSEVQLVDATALGDDAYLILSLEDGTSYLIPGQRQIAASAGVEVAIRFLPPRSDGELRQACTIQVLGLPIILDGEEVIHRAQRPFEVFGSDNPACGRSD